MKSVFKPCLFGLFLLLTGLSVFPSSAQADEDGRYRALVLQEGGVSPGGGSLTPRVFLIDSRDGHMWIFEKNIPLVNLGKQSFGTMLTYQGQLKPGKKAGDIIFQEDNTP